MDMSLKELQEYLRTPEVLESKTDAENIFSFVRYKEGTTRGNENVSHVTAFVLDFDLKDPLPEKDPQGQEKITEIIAQSSLNDHKHFWYTTFSFEPSRPNFRLILPLKEEITPDEYKKALPRIIASFKSHKPDTCSKAVAQVYFGPAINVNTTLPSEERFFHGSALNKPYMNIQDYLKAEIPLKEDTSTSAPQQSIFSCTRKQTSNASKDKQQERYQKALTYIDPDLPYDQWIQVGMSLYKEFGDSGFALWDRWSQKGNKYQYNQPNQMEAHWKSFCNTKIDGGALVNLAKEKGFHPKEIKEDKKVVYPNPTTEEVTNEPLEVVDDDPSSPEFEDEHYVFKDWGEFEKTDIYDLSHWPLLNWLNKQFLANCNPDRHELRLASIISIAGHILCRSYMCPKPLNMYVLAIMPTCSGKDLFLKVNETLLGHFNVASDEVGKIGSTQGLQKKLVETSGNIFNMIDEISELLKIMRSHGSANLEALKRDFKLLSSSKKKFKTDLIKGDEVQTLRQTFVSLYWTGTEHCFKYLSEDDFLSGLMGRFLFFFFNEEVDYGVDEDEIENVDNDVCLVDLEDLNAPTFQYNFGTKILYGEGVKSFYGRFRNLLNQKKRKLSSLDLRRPMFGRACEYAIKLATLTVNSQGMIDLPGMKWAVSVVIQSLKTGSYLTQTYYGLDYIAKDVLDIRIRIEELIKKAQKDNPKSGTKITLRTLSRSLRKLSRKRIEEALERLVMDGAIERHEAQNKRGSPTPLITLLRPASAKNYLFNNSHTQKGEMT